MPFTPDSSVNSVTHVTLSHEGKEEDYRYTRRQVTRMPLHYTKCLEKRQSNVSVQIGAQQAQTVCRGFSKAGLCLFRKQCIWTERNTQDVLYTVYEGEKSLRLCQGSAESSSSNLLQADFKSSFDKSPVTISTAASSSRTATPMKDVLRKKTFQQYVASNCLGIEAESSTMNRSRSFTHKNQTYKWSPFARDPNWIGMS